MGVHQSRLQHKKFDRGEWQLVAEPSDGRPNLLRHRLYATEMEEYPLYLCNSLEVEKYLELFYWRLGSDCLVSSLNYNAVNSSYGCGCSELLMYLYLERLVHRLDELTQLGTHEVVYAMTIALQGFQYIYKKFGYVDIEPGMFFVNSDRRLKVWLSTDPSAHKPRIPKCVRQKRSEYDMVQGIFYQLLKMVSTSCKQQFLEYLGEMTATPNFSYALFLIKMFGKQYNIRQVRCFDSRFQMDSRTVKSLPQTDFSVVKNSISRMLNYKERDSISSKDRYDEHQDRSKHYTEPNNKTCSCQTMINNANTAVDWWNASGIHRRQESAPPMYEYQVTRGHSQGKHVFTRQKKPYTKMETILSGITTPKDSYQDREEEMDRVGTGGTVVIPAIPLHIISRNVSSVPSGNSNTITFNELKQQNSGYPSDKVFSSTSSQKRSEKSRQNRPSISTEDPPKISLKKLHNTMEINSKNVPYTKLAGIRRTISICVRSTNQLQYLHALRNHVSYLAYQQQPINTRPNSPNDAVSYEIITSQSNASHSSQQRRYEYQFDFFSNIQN